MDNKVIQVIPSTQNDSEKQSQSLTVDGCKIKLNYAATSAANVLRDIQKNMVSQYAAQK